MGKNRIAWALTLLGATAAYLFENNGGTRSLLLAVIAVPLLSLAALLLWGRGAAEVLAPPSCPREGEAEIAVRIGGGRLFPVRLRLRAENLFTGERQERLILQAGESRLTLCPARCGCYRIAAARAERLDPLGLFRKKLSCGEAAHMLVLPRRFPLEVELADTGDFWADTEPASTLRPGNDPSETFQIREYAPGDPIRQIHWKLSEKSGKTLVRDFGLPVVRSMLLLIETGGGREIPPDRMEQCLELLASLSAALTGQGIRHRIAQREICSAEDGEAALRALLSRPAGKEEGTVCARWRAEHPGIDFAHGAVISPGPQPDLDGLVQGNRVTLLIPGETFDPEELAAGRLRLIL